MTDSRTLEHRCHVPTCQTKCKPEWLMCWSHWKKVPKRLQKEVWKHYVPGQCDLDPMPTAAWHAAADAAIDYVVQLERKNSGPRQTRLI